MKSLIEKTRYLNLVAVMTLIAAAAVISIERMIEGKDALQLLYLGGAVALVSAALIAFSVLGEKD